MTKGPGRVVATVEIDLPLPGQSLHAHAKGSWRAKAKPVKDARQTAMWATRAAWDGSPWKKAEVDYLFRLPDNRRRDEANLVASCKAYIDGVVDAGLIADDCWQGLSLGSSECVIDRDAPGVTLLFRRIA
jgi:crossover junction endodeoxyribonuclease RusA